MATYLQGVTDYVPQVQPWKPNYNFYQPIFQQKQAKQDQGWNKINNMYNSVLNAPMLREDNKLHRDEFFKNAEQQIKQLSGVDLSLAQNVDAASQVFAPFYEDAGILKDMGFTKKYQNQMQHSEYLRNCNDPKKCGDKYWNGGVRALNYQAEDFINATAEEALKMRAPQYTENYNLMKNAQAAVKDAGFSMKFDKKEGGYMVTTKGGAQMTVPLMNFMMNRFGDDPRLQEYYSTKAFLLTRENPEAANKAYLKAMQNPNIPEEQAKKEAQDEAFTQTYTESRKVIENTSRKEANRFMSMVKKKDVLTENLRKNGVVPGSKEANTFLSSVRDANEQESAVNNLENINTASQNTEAGLQEKGLAANKNQMTNVIANAMKIQDMYNTANTISTLNYERTVKADQFALQNNSFNNSLKLEGVRNQNSMINKAYDYIYKKSLTEIKGAQNNGNVSTGIPNWIRPDDDAFNRIRQYQNNRTTGNNKNSAMQLGDMLAANILKGMPNPSSNVSQSPDMIQKLIQEGRFEEALTVAQGNVVEPGSGSVMLEPVTKEPDLEYDYTKAGEGTNMLTSILARYKMPVKEIDYKTGETREADFQHSEKSIKVMKDRFNGVRAYTGERVNDWKNSSSFQKAKINRDILKTQFNIAADGQNSDSEAMQLELLDLGAHIDANFMKFGKMAKMRKKFGGDISKDYKAYKRAADSGWGDIPSLTAQEFKLIREGLPTNYRNSNKATPEQYRKIKNIGFDKIIALAGGNKGLYDFNEEASGTWLPEGEAGEYIDAESAGIMSHAEYAKFANIVQEEAGNLKPDGSYVNPKLTPDVIEALGKYEKYNSQTQFERKYGIGSDIPSVQRLNAAHAPYKFEVALNDHGAQQAIDRHNAGLNEAKDKLNPQTDSTSGSIWNAIMDKIVIQGGDNELSRIATKSELTGILADAIPDLIADPSFAQKNNLIFHGKWGHSVNKFKTMNMYDGKTSTKSMLNLLSVSNYASKAGASDGAFRMTSAKPQYSEHAESYTQAIAGWKFNEDQKKPFEERKYKNLEQAYVETDSENPLGSMERYSVSGYELNNPLRRGSENKSEAYDEKAQSFLKFIGSYPEAVSTEYSKGGGLFNVAPNMAFYDRNRGDNAPLSAIPTIMDFDLGKAKIDEAWINVFENHNATIGTAYEELLTNFTDAESSFGGMFTSKDGTPVGQATMNAIPVTMKAVTPLNKDQSYFDSMDILAEATKKGVFEVEEGAGGVLPQKILNELTASLKVGEYSKNKGPLWDLKVHPFAGSYNTTEYELTLLDPDWLLVQGYNKKNSSGEVIEETSAPFVYKWKVEDATDPVSTGSHPTAWDAAVGTLGIGETYTNNSLNSQYGKIHYSKVDKGSIQPGYTIDLFNPESGKEEEITFYAPTQAYSGTDWVDQRTRMVDEMINAREISEATKRKYNLMRGITDPQEFLQGMADQIGISVEELVNSFK